MKLSLQETPDSEKIFIVASFKNELGRILKKRLARYNYKISWVKSLPKKISGYSYLFFIDGKIDHRLIKNTGDTGIKTLFVLIDDKERFEEVGRYVKKEKYRNIKLANIESSLQNGVLEKLLWFFFLSEEKEIDFATFPRPLTSKPPSPFLPSGRSVIKKKRVAFLVILALLILESFFLLPLLFSSIMLYKSTSYLNTDRSSAFKYANLGTNLLTVTERSYLLSRPLLSLFYLAPIPDAIISVEKSSFSAIKTVIMLHNQGQEIMSLVMNQNKTASDREALKQRLEGFNKNIQELYQDVSRASETTKNIPFFRNSEIHSKVIDYAKTLGVAASFTPHLEEILGSSIKKSYLLLFLNNMELRPGGGFIGSFGIADFEGLTFKGIRVYDVYDADGQLKIHVEPPEAIRKYLNQPHWFLRDSAFSPDFAQNAKIAEFFLNQEMNIGPFDGSFGITVTGLSYLLNAFGEVYVPDFSQVVDSSNFYIKTQLISEDAFFPGSIQKKSFLSSVVAAMTLKLDSVPVSLLFKEIKKAASEKQLVINLNDTNLQKEIAIAGWDGAVHLPKFATATKNCIVNSILPVEANMGVNKVNYFVTRYASHLTRFHTDGTISSVFKVTLKNNSPENVFPGGTYKNFYQLYLPANIVVDRVEKDGEQTDFLTQKKADFTNISIFAEIAPKKKVNIEVFYRLGEKLKSGDATYQLTMQKQIGAGSSDLSISFVLPETMKIDQANFPSLEKTGTIKYNTSLSTDKIFIIRLKNRQND